MEHQNMRETVQGKVYSTVQKNNLQSTNKTTTSKDLENFLINMNMGSMPTLYNS